MNQKPALHSIADERLDREFESALAVDPSPEFLVRVRARIAEERSAGARSGKQWIVGALASMAIAVLAMVIVWESREPEVPVGMTRPAVLPDARNAPLTVAGNTRVIANLTPTIGGAGVRPRVTTIPDPEVLISVGEAAALKQLFGDINQGRIEPPLLPTVVPSGPLVPIDEIHIEPIAVDASQ